MDYFKKCPNLDIPTQIYFYIFYSGLHLEHHDMIDALKGGSVINKPIDNA